MLRRQLLTTAGLPLLNLTVALLRRLNSPLPTELMSTLSEAVVAGVGPLRSSVVMSVALLLARLSASSGLPGFGVAEVTGMSAVVVRGRVRLRLGAGPVVMVVAAGVEGVLLCLLLMSKVLCAMSVVV